MLLTWRWYGPNDPISLDQIKQTGATGIVTALHETYDGQEWAREDIKRQKTTVEAAGMTWAVVESIPVHTSIKLGSKEASQYIEAYKATIRKLAEIRIKTICYNFMPVVDWTRTDLRYPAPTGGFALRFDMIDFITYDIFILERPDGQRDYPENLIKKAKKRFLELSKDEIVILEQTIIAGLPGAELSHDRESIQQRIDEYTEIDNAQLQGNLITFLKEIIPVAEEVGVNMCLHPDDPPYSLFGLPRVVSTAEDYRTIFQAVPSLSNGITFCTGSLGPRADNNLLAMVREFADRIHFTHLRNVCRQEDGSFFEAGHLDGDLNLIEIASILLKEEKRRQNDGRVDWEIPMRPDHGHLLLDDIEKQTNPGYSAIGRLKGLAELRGVIKTLAVKDG